MVQQFLLMGLCLRKEQFLEEVYILAELGQMIQGFYVGGMEITDNLEMVVLLHIIIVIQILPQIHQLIKVLVQDINRLVVLGLMIQEFCVGVMEIMGNWEMVVLLYIMSVIQMLLQILQLIQVLIQEGGIILVELDQMIPEFYAGENLQMEGLVMDKQPQTELHPI